MKTIAILIILLATIFCAGAQLVTNQPARFATKIICYEGKINSSEKNTTTIWANGIGTGGSDIYTDAVTTAGKEHNLKWSFVGRNGDKDVYDFTFTRMTAVNSRKTSWKEVDFDGKQIVVFEDDLHTVVMETPNENDLKNQKGGESTK